MGDTIPKPGGDRQEPSAKDSLPKNLFLGAICHEIRTPLHGVLGMSSTLLHSALDVEQREQVKVIHDCALSLVTLVDDLMDLAAVDAGRLRIRNAPLDLHRTLDGVVAMFIPEARAKGLEFQLIYPETEPEGLTGDAGRIRQIAVNLVSNAIKFTDAGRVRVTVGFSPRVGDCVTASIEVNDTGIGIADEHLPMLFTDYFQVQPAARGGGGAGLGLSLSRRLALLMGGDIDVSTVVASGSAFTLRVPLLCLEEAAGTGARADAGVAAPAASFAGRRVLVVDDNLVNRTVTIRLLETLGCEATAASSGADAVEMASTESFALILMDRRMPGLDGIEATSRIRDLEGAAAQVPIVALTASALPNDRQTCLAAGMNDFLSKPLRLEELLAVLKRWASP